MVQKGLSPLFIQVLFPYVFSTLKVLFTSNALLTHIHTLPNVQNLACHRKSEARIHLEKKMNQAFQQIGGVYQNCLELVPVL